MRILFPKCLSIQTTSLCNAACIFCPYASIKDLFPNKIMEMSLFKKIIDECSQHKNVERIILYMNNEPLTDPCLAQRADYAKEKLPWAGVHILTNGALLTEEIAGKLLRSKLDWIGISFHGIRKDTIEKAMGINYERSLERICAFIKKAESSKNIKEYIMITFLRHKYLTDDEKREAEDFWRARGIERISYFDGPISRAGNVEGLAKVYHREAIVGCNSIWADEMIHIVEDGSVVLCCMDWKREVVLGDLNTETLVEVWNGKRSRVWDGIEGKEELAGDFPCRRCEAAKVKTQKTPAE